MKTYYKILLVIILLVCTIIYSIDIVNYSIDIVKVGWLVSFLTPKVLIIFLSGVLSVLVYRIMSLGKLKRLLTGALVFFLPIGIYLMVHPPYVEDYEKRGVEVAEKSFPNNSIILRINETQPQFNGLISIASPGCAHCIKATSKMSRMLARDPSLDLIVFLYTKKQEKLDKFRAKATADNLPIVMVPDGDDAMILCQGRFPTFLYMKNGDIIHMWSNDQFGYPAFSWVENKLN
jgi:hypothetical protein